MQEKTEYERRIRDYEKKFEECFASIASWQQSYNTLVEEHNDLRARYAECTSQNADLQAQINAIKKELAAQNSVTESESLARKKVKTNTPKSLAVVASSSSSSPQHSLDLSSSPIPSMPVSTGDEMEAESNGQNKKVLREERPPPIFVEEVANYAKFSAFLEANGVDQCLRKETASKEIILATKTVDEYRNLQKLLLAENKNRARETDIGAINLHTYQLKSERAFIVFIRHLSLIHI